MAEELKALPREELEAIVKRFNNDENLRRVLRRISQRLVELAERGVAL